MSNQNPGINVPAIGTCDRQVRQSIQDIIRRLGVSSTPTFSTLNLASLTASKLVKTNAGKDLASADLVDHVDGTTNQISVSDDGDGSITLATPQDTHTGASPTFAGLMFAEVDALPTAETGLLVHLTTDNRLYFAKPSP